MRAGAAFRAVLVLSITMFGCGGGRHADHPAPTYERWTLPAWSPPEPDVEDDPTSQLAEMEGEWVTESKEEGASESDDEGTPESEEGGAAPLGASDAVTPDSSDAPRKEIERASDAAAEDAEK